MKLLLISFFLFVRIYSINATDICNEVESRTLNNITYYLQPIDEEVTRNWLKVVGDLNETHYKGDLPSEDIHNQARAIDSFSQGVTKGKGWIAYASTSAQPLKTTEEIKKSALIFMTVTDCGLAISHYGIFRNIFAENARGQGQLALKLHGFSAKLMREKSSSAKYLIVPPIGRMDDILQNSGLVKNTDYQVFLSREDNEGYSYSEIPNCLNRKDSWFFLENPEVIDKKYYLIKDPEYIGKGQLDWNRKDENWQLINSLKNKDYLLARLRNHLSGSPLYIIRLESLEKLFL